MDRHHKILAPRGELVRIFEADNIQSFQILAEQQSTKDFINDGTWNDYELIVKDNLIFQNRKRPL